MLATDLGLAGNSREKLSRFSRSRILDKSKTSLFLILLVITKGFATLSIFFLWKFLQNRHDIVNFPHHSPPTGVVFGNWSQVIQTFTVVQIIAATVYVIIQKPFSNWSSSKISRRDWIRIFRHGAVSLFFLFVWVRGLQLCGSFRTILISSHYNFTLAGIIAGLFIAKSGVKLRGSVLFLAGLLILLLFDDNVSLDDIQHARPTPNFASPTPESDTDQSFISNNSVGILLLVIYLLYKTGFETSSKSLAVDLGGSKRLHALSTTASAAICFILYLTDLMSGADMMPFWSNLFMLGLITIFGFVLDFYVDKICLKRLEPNKVVKIGTSASMFSAVIYVLLVFTEKFPSTFTLIAAVLIYFGIVSLTSPEKASGGGSFVGYSSDGLPLFSFSNHFSADSYIPMWKSCLRLTSTVLRQIKDDTISRRIFYYSLLTLTFTAIEFLYGTITNSLGMITDGFHMLFDTMALCIGLSASVICRWKPSKSYQFGYGRIEVLSGFLNSFFLLVIALVILIESFQRLHNPPEVDAQRVLPISIAGLIINLIGIYTFRASCGIMNSFSNNVNVKGVFLHILADTMGSIGVIISSVMMHNYQFYIADPICSIIIASLIVISVVPLLKETSQILLLTVPSGLEKSLQQTVLQLLTTEGVKGYRNARFWTHSPNHITGSIHVQATEDANEQQVIRQVNNLFSSIGFTHFTTQLEKDEFIARKSYATEYEIENEGRNAFDSSLKGFGSDSVEVKTGEGPDKSNTEGGGGVVA